MQSWQHTLLLFPSGVNVADCVKSLILTWTLLTLWEVFIKRKSKLQLESIKLTKAKNIISEEWYLYHPPGGTFTSPDWRSSALMSPVFEAHVILLMVEWGGVTASLSRCDWSHACFAPPSEHERTPLNMSLLCVYLCIFLTAVYLCINTWWARLKVNLKLPYSWPYGN